MEKLKIGKHGIRHNGEYHRAFYSKGTLFNYPAGTISVYAKDYKPLPAALSPKNDSDYQSDYVVQDVARITPDHTLYSEFAKYAR